MSFPLKANKKMQAELDKVKSNPVKGGKSHAYQTPPPKVAAPSPIKPPVEPTPTTKAKTVVPPPDGRPAPATEGAKLNRLRRLCEKKPSGRCNVPEGVHERWRSGSREEREAMIQELEGRKLVQGHFTWLFLWKTMFSTKTVVVSTGSTWTCFLWSGSFHIQDYQNNCPEQEVEPETQTRVVHKRADEDNTELVDVTSQQCFFWIGLDRHSLV